MGSIHAAGEWLRLSEHYRQMTDGELIAIARDRSQLTEIAQEILAQELSQRKLKVEPEEQPTGLESTRRTAMAASAHKAGTPPTPAISMLPIPMPMAVNCLR